MNINNSAESIAQPKVSEKLLFLDGVRGFSALWVLLSHGLAYVGYKSVPLISKGDLAVDVFMIMSGFLMCFHYYKRADREPWESAHTWRTFYLRRFFRIAPLYYLLLIVAFAFNDFFAQHREFLDTVYPLQSFERKYGSAENFFSYKYMGATLTNVFTHVTFLFGLLPKYSTATPLPDWSIGLEMQFYAFFPFIMLLLKWLSCFWAALLLLGIGEVVQKLLHILPLSPPGFAEPFPLPSFLFLKLEFFIIGILLASAYTYRNKKPALCIWSAGLAVVLSAYKGGTIILAISVLVTLLLFYDQKNDPLRIAYFVAEINKILGNRVASFMADTSYSVYLLHTLIMPPIAAALIVTPGFVNLPGIARIGLLLLGALPITYGLSWLLFQCIETPGIVVGKKLIKALDQS